MENKVKRVEPVIAVSNFRKKASMPVPCPLKGCSPCPYPDMCDGSHRMCDFWKRCSSK